MIDQEVAKNRGANVRKIAEILSANGDPRTAQAVLDKYKDQMDAGSVLAVTSHLKSLNAQLDGHAIADEETGRAPRGGPPAPVANVPASFVGAIKREEGFDPKPRWDVKQWTVGYGTRASGPDERPDQAELERRFQSEVGKAAKIVDGVNPNLDPGTRAALTSLTYNTGDAWTHSGLGEKVRSGDIAGAQHLFLQYGNVAGQPNAAIEERRWRESQWFGRAEAPAGGPMPDKAQAYDRIVARTDGNPLMQAAALGRMNQTYSVERGQNTQDLALFKRRFEDTTAEAYKTGSVVQPLTENDFVQQMGLRPGRQNYQSYVGEIQNSVDRHAMEDMSEGDMRALIESRTPAPGSVDYAQAADRQDRLTKAMREIETQRREDPAGAVRKSPAVTGALAQYDPKKPETFRSVASARLAAQEQLGIEPEYRSPITKAEALQLTEPLRTMLPGQEREVLTQIGQKFEQMFGDEADPAFGYALRAQKIDAATSQLAARVMRKIALGQQLASGDARQLDDAQELDAAQRAVTSPTWFERLLNSGAAPELAASQAAIGVPDYSGGATPSAKPIGPQLPAIKPRAIVYLLAHPETAAAFDKEFARPGMAKSILEKYSTAAGKPGGRTLSDLITGAP